MAHLCTSNVLWCRLNKIFIYLLPNGSIGTDADVDNSIARSRGRRSKKDKTGRLAALEKLKKAKEKGEKWKYEVGLIKSIHLAYY